MTRTVDGDLNDAAVAGLRRAARKAPHPKHVLLRMEMHGRLGLDHVVPCDLPAHVMDRCHRMGGLDPARAAAGEFGPTCWIDATVWVGSIHHVRENRRDGRSAAFAPHPCARRPWDGWDGWDDWDDWDD